MNSRLRTTVNGLGSILLLGLLLIGPPLALAKLVGWPLPTAIPSFDALDLALRSGVSDVVVAKGLALVGWAAWLQVALAIVVEAIAVVRGRPARSVPVLPGFQASAGRLVASVAMMFATLSPAAAGASVPPSPIVAFAAPVQVEASVVPATAAPPSPSVRAEPLTPSPAPPPPSPATVTVERHDSFWAIAERTLGDGYRWREIRDLNVGRLMNTGDVVRAGSDLVHPGWVLDLPADAQVPMALDASGEPATNGPSEVVVEPGDNFWELAEEQLTASTGEEPTDAETAPYWHEMIDADADRLAQPGNPSLILPGQHLAVPPIPGAEVAEGGPAEHPVDLAEEPASAQPPTESPVTEAPEPSPGQPAPTVADSPASTAPVIEAVPAQTPTSLEPAPAAPTEPTPRARVDDDLEDGSESAVPAIALGVASAALAVGATRAIRRRRLRAARRAPMSPPPTDDEAGQAVHRELVVDADEDSVKQLRSMLGSLASTLAATDANARPRVVQHGPDHLDLVMTAPCEPPNGWHQVGDDALWTLDHTTPHGDEPAICAAPLLVTLGQPDDGGQLYLDLEAERQVALVGDHDTACSIARAILLELALTPLADSLEVIVIGDLAPPEVAGLDHVTLAPAWDDVSDDLIAWAQQSHDAISDMEWPNAFIARGIDPYHDALAPIVAVAAEPPPPRLLATMADHVRSTLTIVAVGEVDEATIIDCYPDHIRVVDLGLECTPHPIEPEVLDVVIDLVTDDETIHVQADGQLSLLPDMITVEPAGDPGTESLEDPDFEILVCVLGDIHVEGGEPLAAKQTAVAAYIALHGTVSVDKLEDAVWASATTTNRRKRLANTISECRAALGRHHFPPASDGRYRAGPGIATDLDLFDLRIRRAAEQPPGDAADTLLSALDLVTGAPFTYRGADRPSFAWVEVESWASTWELKIAAVAQRCADLLLDLGRCEEAIDAMMRALAAMPTHTGVTETLMRAHAANGDRLAVRRVYEEHLKALDSLDLDAPDESTTDLFDQLLEVRTA